VIDIVVEQATYQDVLSV